MLAVIDFVTPLGRPPLDTFSPTQEVRTADVLPAGEWEIEAGTTWGFAPLASVGTAGAGALSPLASLLGGLGRGFQIAVGLPGPSRRTADLAYGVIPGLLAVDAAYGWATAPGTVDDYELGSQVQLETPWGTPRIAPRLAFRQLGASASSIKGNQWIAKLDLGYEYPFGQGDSAGVDADLDVLQPAASQVAVGVRARLIANVGGAVFASYQPVRNAVAGGVVLATKFFGG